MDTSSYTEIKVDLSQVPVAIVVLNRPDRLNALSRKMRQELVEALNRLDESPDVRSIVITGAGQRAFAAGQDLTEARTFTGQDVTGWIDDWTGLFQAVLNLKTPTVAAVEGYAVGAGFQLASVCDLRIASDNARFGMPEVDDAIPCITGMWCLYDLIGRGRVADLVLTGRMLDASEAHAWGIVTHVVASGDLREVAVRVADRLAAKSATAIELNKQMLAKLMHDRLPEFESCAKTAHGIAFRSGEPQDVMEQFLEKRGAGRSV